MPIQSPRRPMQRHALSRESGLFRGLHGYCSSSQAWTRLEPIAEQDGDEEVEHRVVADDDEQQEVDGRRPADGLVGREVDVVPVAEKLNDVGMTTMLIGGNVFLRASPMVNFGPP